MIHLHNVQSNDLDAATLERIYPSHPLQRGLRVNMASSLDGVIALNGRSQALSGDLDKIIFRFLRSTASAIVVGARTAQVEHYGPVSIAAPFQHHRATIEGLTPSPPLVVIGSYREGDLSWLEQLRDAANPTRIALFGMSSTKDLGDGLINDSQNFDLRTPRPLISHLMGNAASPILCEGGPSLLTTLINEHLIEEICLSQAHLFAGRSDAVLLNKLEPSPTRVSLAARIDAVTHTFSRLTIEHQTADDLTAEPETVDIFIEEPSTAVSHHTNTTEHKRGTP